MYNFNSHEADTIKVAQYRAGRIAAARWNGVPPAHGGAAGSVANSARVNSAMSWHVCGGHGASDRPRSRPTRR